MYPNIFYIALFLGIIPLWVLFFKKRAFSLAEPIQPFIWLTFIATLYEGVATFLFSYDTSYWFQANALFEFSTIFYFFFRLFKVSHKKLLYSFLIVLLVVYCSSFYYWLEYSQLVANAVNKIPITLFVFTFSFIWFKELFDKMEILNPWQHPNFYFIVGFMIYHAATAFLFVLSSILFDSNYYFYDFWLVNVMATFLLRATLIIGVWKMEKV